MKKILLSIMIIAVVIAIAAGGTMAYFSESSNQLTASVAAADVKMEAGGPGWVTELFAKTGVVPGDKWTQDVYVKNTGNATLYITPVWSPDPKAGDNPAIDKAMKSITPVLISGASWVKEGIYKLEVGAEARFQITLEFMETGAPQNALQGQILHYKGGFYGQTSPDYMQAYTVGL